MKRPAVDARITNCMIGNMVRAVNAVRGLGGDVYDTDGWFVRGGVYQVIGRTVEAVDASRNETHPALQDFLRSAPTLLKRS